MNAAYSLQKVCFSYGDRIVLNIDALDIPSRQITALIGPNGAGKSTLLSILGFLNRPDSGTLLHFGRAVNSSNLIEVRRSVGMVPQNPYFLNGTVLYNVELGMKLRGVSGRKRRTRAISALQAVDSAAKAQCDIDSLSGGERQRVALARALVQDPEILLFDEPFTYLDFSAVNIIEHLINRFVKDRCGTVVFSTHDRLHGTALSDRVITLVNGRVADTPLVNLFKGEFREGMFDTGEIRVLLPASANKASHIAIDPNEIVLSVHPLESSMRNCFEGRVSVIAEYQGRIRTTVVGPERFEVLITQQSLTNLGLEIGSKVWVNFKSTAVRVLED